MFYLDSILEAGEGFRQVNLSDKSYWLCWQALTSAESQDNWESSLTPLDATEWDMAQSLLDTCLTELRGDVMKLEFLAYLSGVQSTEDYDELFELDSVEFNNGGQFNVANHTWTVPSSGVYQVGAWVQYWDLVGADNWVRVRTKLNGSYHLNSGNQTPSDDEYPHAFMDNLPAVFVAGDSVQFFITHSNVGTPRSTANYNLTCRAWAFRVG